MYAIIKIQTELQLIQSEIDITIRPDKDAAENVIDSVQEYLFEFKKDYPASIVNRIFIENEKTGVILADLNFKP